MCWTDSQDKLAKGTLFWVLLSVGKSLVVECVAVAFLKVVIEILITIGYRPSSALHALLACRALMH